MSTVSKPDVPPKKDFLTLAAKLLPLPFAERAYNLLTGKELDHYTDLINDLDAYKQMIDLFDRAYTIAKEIGRYEQSTGLTSSILNEAYEDCQRKFLGYYTRQAEPIAKKLSQLLDRANPEFKSEF